MLNKLRPFDVAITTIVILSAYRRGAYRARMTSSVDSIPAQTDRAVSATFKQALFIAVTAGLGYGFDSYAVNIYGLVCQKSRRRCTLPKPKPGT